MIEKNKRKEFVVEGYIIHENKVLLIFHKKHKKWLPPGGHVIENEIPEETLKRELREETGFEVEIVGKKTPVDYKNIKLLANPSHIQLEEFKDSYHVDMVFLCRIKKGILVGNSESEQRKFFTADELENFENIPEDVKFFSKFFINKEKDILSLKLPVLSKIVNSSREQKGKNFNDVSLLVVQHIKNNTVEFIRLLKKAGFKKITVIGKPYSYNPDAEKEISSYAEIIVPKFEEMESMEIIREVVEKEVSRGNKFVCLDLGGHFSEYFQKKATPEQLKYLLGIVEDTKNGIWFDEKEKLKFPLLSVASSLLKDSVEIYFVSNSVARNAENVLINYFQQTLNNKKVLVLGYGMIGEKLSKILKINNSVVTVYDRDKIKLIRARVEGFNVLTSLEELSEYDIIFGTTGDYVLGKELSSLKNSAVLINASTRKKEFNFEEISSEISTVEEKEGYSIIKVGYGKRIFLLNGGFPINFFKTESVPEYILDLVFSEIFLSVEKILSGKLKNGFYPIEKHFPEIETKAAEIWLDFW